MISLVCISRCRSSQPPPAAGARKVPRGRSRGLRMKRNNSWTPQQEASTESFSQHWTHTAQDHCTHMLRCSPGLPAPWTGVSPTTGKAQPSSGTQSKAFPSPAPAGTQRTPCLVTVTNSCPRDDMLPDHLCRACRGVTVTAQLLARKKKKSRQTLERRPPAASRTATL